jgi:hypothetical protein
VTSSLKTKEVSVGQQIDPSDGDRIVRRMIRRIVSAIPEISAAVSIVTNSTVAARQFGEVYFSSGMRELRGILRFQGLDNVCAVPGHRRNRADRIVRAIQSNCRSLVRYANS